MVPRVKSPPTTAVLPGVAQVSALSKTSSLTDTRSRSAVRVQFALIGFVLLGDVSVHAVTVGASGAIVSTSISAEQAEVEVLSATSVVTTSKENMF